MVVVRSNCDAFVTLPERSALQPLICKDFPDRGRRSRREPARSPKNILSEFDVPVPSRN